MTAISVIIPAHNAAATIAATLASLRSEAEVIGEVLLVDDSSSDGTAEAALNAATQFSLPLRVLKSSCRDAGGSRNVALAQAQCSWIYLIDADDLHLEGGLRSMLVRAGEQPAADMVIGAYRRRTDGENRNLKLPAGYIEDGIANASAYLEGHIRSIAVGSALVSRRVVGDTRFPTGLAYDEDTLFWSRLMGRASLALIVHPVMIYHVSAVRSDDRFITRPVRRFLDWRLALRELTDCGIPLSSLKTREGLVALKIARVHYARGDLETAARFLRIAAAAPKVRSNTWRCRRYQLKLALRRWFSSPRVQLQRA
ncbi:glycosyltransferase family 2 protein [Mesorhizobium sp. M0761]|uniref:glycosyltransferase family 2 protein n=1 Tax=unclassified Mesorhizobium TaxID=325217 RepID=UPI0003CF1E50|nr:MULTISPECIES: glycosyltransferase family 2 protein [unclassified Mesorhizobium]ESW93241.1 glycosyl transferase family A [Mesorhizobium sp. LSJC269B00]ESX20696.1 glycosyl transferase family A [Mesorhizobium sp. LSJC255A00]ESX32077.1 glycosyl transferase family A [Mesorhizobium sp. LSHC440B00]ESX39207.1 glycosyl transferase family A [Mesorhizobium sp. LSHC432A00]ESX44153.1 glycosyl transferase family A [Mesorhizobium sp. LSHC440A00]